MNKLLVLLCTTVFSLSHAFAAGAEWERRGDLVAQGRYLAQIGVCAACHTPPAVPAGGPQSLEVTQLRANPNWTAYLDKTKALAGGVPFIIRLPGGASGTVVSRNLTPDAETGLGSWSVNDIVAALKYGVRPNGEALFIFPPNKWVEWFANKDKK